MNAFDRREFLRKSGKLTLGLAVGGAAITAPRRAKAVSPNEKIVIAVVGVRGRGAALSIDFAMQPNCEVGYLADVDTSLFSSTDTLRYDVPWHPSSVRGLRRLEGFVKTQGKAPKTVQDFRRILDDKSVDAVVIATPDHWHALAAVWTCQAGKDVYVEKPVSHCPWEGRKMIEVARTNHRIVQAGTQSRSAPCYADAKKYITDGKLGKIHFCRVCNMKTWGNFPMTPDCEPPKGFDWEMWNGPAPDQKYNVTLRNGWHHFWRYSGGDIINDSIHQLDLARWLCGVEYPTSIYSTGGRFNQEGAAETPDTQIAVWNFDKLEMVFEQTLYTPYIQKSDMEMRNTDGLWPYWPQNTERLEIYGEDGMMCVCRHGVGWQVFGRPKGRRPVVVAEKHGRFPDAEHKENFLSCIRNRNTPNADIREGHLSALLAQTANISYRLGGQKLLLDAKTETFTNSPEGNAMLKREYRKPWTID